MSILKLLFIDTILDIFYFPLWWYSRGMVLAFAWVGREMSDTQQFLGIGIWIKNLFKPMYGQRDWQGKIISFFMRVFQIIFRSIIFLGFCAVYILLFIVYMILPVFVAWGVLFHLPGDV